MKLMFSLNQQGGKISDFFGEMKTKCQRFKFDNIGIAFKFKHTIITENIAGKKRL